jgi:DNA-binding NtrC family response regulator
MASRNISILVVDDDQNIRTFVAKILAAKNWHVDTAEDGPSALLLIHEHTYDAVVLDYRMPGMDGVEVCRKIKEIQPATREVFLTGFPTINTVFPAIEAGAERVLSKPVNPEELIQVVEQQLADSETP